MAFVARTGRVAGPIVAGILAGGTRAMSLLDGLALAVVALAGLYFLALGGASLIVPTRASRFLLGFAGSLGAHLLELALRMIAGVAFVVAAPRMLFPGGFAMFGWALLISTVCLLAVPWRWHQRFAQYVVPHAIRLIHLIGLASLGAGVFVLVAAVGGGAT